MNVVNLKHDMPTHSDTRTVILDYWYTTAQMNDVGLAWARAASNRLFIKTETVGKTGIKKEHLDQITHFPLSIMLPLNRSGNHWTSIAIALTEHDGQIDVRMSYSDSLGHGSIPRAVRDEMHRIAALFRKQFGQDNVTITQEIYPHAWRQSDGSSCGPYALKNAERCLAGKEDELNPGRKIIREQQLDLMTKPTAIKGCSTNNEIDEILVHWMIDCISNQQPYAISSAQGVTRICEKYAAFKRVDPIDREVMRLRRVFIDEYGLEYGLERGIPEENLMRHLPVVTRMRELLQKYDLFCKELSPAQYETQLKILRRENAMAKIERIRMAIAKASEDNVYAYGATADIIDLVARMNIAEAVEKLTRVVTVQAESDPCLSAIAEMTGSRGIEKDYALKLIRLAKAYRSIHEAAIVIKTIESPINAPKELLEAQVNLLHAAIRRNDASLLMRVAYILSDFCSVLAEIITLGWWEPDFRKIEVIEEKLHANQEEVLPADYKTELTSIQCLYRSKNLLAQEAKKAAP